MSHPLDGIRFKLQRANESILNLDREIVVFLKAEPKPYRIVGVHRDGGEKYVFIAYGEPRAPLRFAVLAGEIIHHLRSVLDHLVHALVVENGGIPLSNNQFPLARTSVEFEKLCSSGLIKGISKTAKKRIRAQQPYHDGEPENTTLRVLHECNILDKHRLLLVVNTVAGIGNSITIDAQEDGVTITHLDDPQPRQITMDGVELFFIRFERSAFKTTEHANFTSPIVFQNVGTLHLVPVVPVLTKMFKKVSAVVQEFKVEFGSAAHGAHSPSVSR